MNLKNKLLAVLVAMVMAASFAVPAFAAPSEEETTAASSTTTTTTSTTTTTTASTTTADTSDESIARATAEGADSEEEEERTVDEIISSYNNNNGRVMSAAKAGYPRLYPEDSLTGLRYCVDNGVDIVSVNVQKTKDGGLVLLEDNDISRMLVDRGDHSAAKGKVSDLTMEEIQNNYYLREGHGGKNRKATKESVPGLHDALELTRNSVMLYIENGFKYADIINDVAKGLNACDVVILGGADSAESIKNFVKETGTPICHITSKYVDGTTEGSARNFIKETLAAGADSVFLASDNDYSSIFKSNTMKPFQDSGRAMVSATSFALSGEHVDRIEGWQELIEAGYSIIETDYPKELSSYIKDIEAYRTELTSLITQAQTLDQDNFSKESAKVLKKSLETAEEASAKGAVSLRQMDEARYNLQESIDALEAGVEVEKAHMPVWQMVLIVIIVLLALAAAVIIALRAFNKRKKAMRSQRKIRKKYKAMSERNLENATTDLEDITPISQDTAGINIYESFTGETLERETSAEPEAPAETKKSRKLKKPSFGKKGKSSKPAKTPEVEAFDDPDDVSEAPAAGSAEPAEPASSSYADDFEAMLKELEDARKNND